MKRKYYSIAEAAEVLDYSEADLWHFVESGQLVPGLLSPTRKYIPVTKHLDVDEWVGHGTCFYRGMLRVHGAWIRRIVENTSVEISGPLKAVDLDAINGWTPQCPYDQKLPAPLYTWIGTSSEELNNGFHLIPAAEVKISKTAVLIDVAVQFQKIQKLIREGVSREEAEK